MPKPLLGLVLLVVYGLGWFNAPTHVQAVPASATLSALPAISDDLCTGTNLIANPSFEGEYSGYIPPEEHPDCEAGICATAQMAPDWTPWWRSHNEVYPPYIIRQPEYAPASPQFIDPPRVRTGETAQKYFTFYSSHRAGFYQRVPVTAGVDYRFCIWGHSWSAQDDDDAYSGPEDGQLRQMVGIDPTGGTDAPIAEGSAPHIIWGDARIQYDEYGLFAVEAIAQADYLTVFVFSEPLYPVKHNDVYWDDAALVSLTPEMDVRGDEQGVTFLTLDSTPQLFSRDLTVTIAGNPAVTWTATLSEGALSPTVWPTSGEAGDSLTVSVHSADYGFGIYDTTLTITASDPDTLHSPIRVPVRLVVAPELTTTAIPLLLQE